MIATVIPPVRLSDIQITLSVEEARVLHHLLMQNVSVPKVLSSEYRTVYHEMCDDAEDIRKAIYQAGGKV